MKLFTTTMKKLIFAHDYNNFMFHIKKDTPLQPPVPLGARIVELVI